eukprot:COSAG05_NODE_2555_length_2910_cov_2.355034_1_plen_108_part_00
MGGEDKLIAVRSVARVGARRSGLISVVASRGCCRPGATARCAFEESGQDSVPSSAVRRNEVPRDRPFEQVFYRPPTTGLLYSRRLGLRRCNLPRGAVSQRVSFAKGS